MPSLAVAHDDLSITPDRPRPGYGRARLWLGIAGVGTVVTLAAGALAAGLPAAVDARTGPSPLAAVVALAVYAAAHAAVQLPFDLLGGYVLPRRYGRSVPPLPTFVGRLARGAFVYAALLFAALGVLLVAGRFGGVWGVPLAALGLSAALLAGRVRVAVALARFRPEVPSGASRFAAADDEGFTGGVLGVLRPRGHLLPARWREVLTPEQLAHARLRREIAVSSGSWRRGRLVALAFNLFGIGVAAAVVGAERLGTAAGTVELSLLFTLWSFLGLLTLPTVSRRGVAEVDARARAAGASDAVAEATAAALDALQDDEPERPAVVEAIFHPVPSVSARSAAAGPPPTGAWDAARTAVYLGLAGGGLLGRAVHCNCGRPALWAFLPVD
jgi:hypothetical protein